MNDELQVQAVGMHLPYSNRNTAVALHTGVHKSPVLTQNSGGGAAGSLKGMEKNHFHSRSGVAPRRLPGPIRVRNTKNEYYEEQVDLERDHSF